jgi:uroporphyrinogen decarboxylase
MNKCERVRAALAGEPVDHVPASFWFHFSPQQTRGRPMAEAHLQYYRACDPDWLKVMMDTGYGFEDGQDRGEVALDLEALATPVPLHAECYQSWLEGYRILLEELAGEAPTLVTLFCPYATLNYATGKQADRLVRERPEACDAALAAITESLAAFGQACLDAGAWGVYFAAQAGEANRLNEEEHRRFVETHDRRLLSRLQEAPFNLIHVCGEGLRMDPYWSYPGACLNWAAGAAHDNPVITVAREHTPMAIAAGLDNRGPVATGPEEALAAAVRAAVAEGGREKFLLAAGCTLPNDVDWSLPRRAREECIRATRL